MNLIKVLSRVNQIEKISFLKILDKFSEGNREKNPQINKILADSDNVLKKAENINIVKLFNLLRNEYTEHLRHGIKYNNYQLDMVVDIFIRDGNQMMSRSWFDTLYKKTIKDLNNHIKTITNQIEKDKTEIINKTWLAYTDPKTFDFVYKDFAIRTNKSWGQVNAKGEMILEPNPYLTEWTINDSEFPYFQIALNKILDYYDLISYADDVSTVRDSFKDLLITQKINFKDPDEEDWAYSYLKKINEELAKKGLVALVTKGYYDIIVCKIPNQDKLIDLFSKIKWELVTP